MLELKPCDTSMPYIFVSYSSQDAWRVYTDVAEFQRRGYNIWLDEKNLDKTKTSWKKDALEAIKDYNCFLVVFYVSKASLTSEPCLNELLMTINEETQDIHFEPVKFICVDVDEIGNIVNTSKVIVDEIRTSFSLSKEEKASRTQTLSRFIRIFFHSNNERVRIHPATEADRKTDYYLDILNSFPNETKCFEERMAEKKKHDDIAEKEQTSKPAKDAVPTAARSKDDSAALFEDEEISAEIREGLKNYYDLLPEGNAADLRNYGIQLVKNKALKKYYAEGVKWLEKAAAKQDATAMNWLGWCYDNAIGVPKDVQKAVDWYKQSTALGNTSAKRSLGIKIMQGKCEDLPLEEGIRYLEESALAGNSTAMNWMAWAYRYGKGVPVDKQKSEEWYRKAVDAGNVDAGISFAAGILGGFFSHIPMEEGIPLMIKGVEKGDTTAMNWMGWCYEYGKGVAVDKQKAIEHYRQSANGGNTSAKKNLARLLLD